MAVVDELGQEFVWKLPTGQLFLETLPCLTWYWCDHVSFQVVGFRSGRYRLLTGPDPISSVFYFDQKKQLPVLVARKGVAFSAPATFFGLIASDKFVNNSPDSHETDVRINQNTGITNPSPLILIRFLELIEKQNPKTHKSG